MAVPPRDLANGYRRLFFVFLGSKTLLTDFQHTKFYPFLNLSFQFILNIFLKCRKSPGYIFLWNILLSKERVYSKLICSTQRRHAHVQVSSRKKTYNGFSQHLKKWMNNDFFLVFSWKHSILGYPWSRMDYITWSNYFRAWAWKSWKRYRSGSRLDEIMIEVYSRWSHFMTLIFPSNLSFHGIFWFFFKKLLTSNILDSAWWKCSVGSVILSIQLQERTETAL